MKLLKLPFESQRLLNNTGWLLATEISAKVSRVLVILALAASLTAIEYGTVMLALACHEVCKLVLRSGAGAQIVQCSEQHLEKYARNGALLQWLVCLTLIGIQAGLAFPLASFYQNPQLVDLLGLMAGAYLLYPLVSIKVFLIQRAGNLRFYGVRNALCIVAENLSIAILALLDFGIMSVVYGKWIFALFWISLFYFAPVKNYGVGFQLKTFLKLIKSSGQLFSTELVKSVRMQLDMLIGARLLSPELFGLYSFAKSAGVGLSISINNAFNVALYPYLCEKHRQGQLTQHIRWVYLLATAVGSLFVLQALAVPFYVPLLFDQQWQQDHSVVILLCLAALPTIYVDIRCGLLRAQAAYQDELYTRIFCLVVSATGILVFHANTPGNFAFSILLSSVVWLAVFIPWRSIYQLIHLPKLPSIWSQSNE